MALMGVRKDIAKTATEIGNQVPDTAQELRKMAQIISVSFVVITVFVVLACVAVTISTGKNDGPETR